jgi:MFS family permease
LIALLYCLSGIGCLLAWSWWVLIACRVLAGLAVGASSVLAPVYLAEIAPARHRGMVVGTFQFNIVLGILVAYLSNAVVNALASGPAVWQIKFGVSTLPALLLLALMFTIPDSPRWLVARGRKEEALGVLTRLGVDDPGPNWTALPAPRPSTAASACLGPGTGGRSCWPSPSPPSISSRASTPSSITSTTSSPPPVSTPFPPTVRPWPSAPAIWPSPRWRWA